MHFGNNLGRDFTEATLPLFVRWLRSVPSVLLTENMDALRLQSSRKGVTQDKPREYGILLQMGQRANCPKCNAEYSE